MVVSVLIDSIVVLVGVEVDVDAGVGGGVSGMGRLWGLRLCR